MEKHAARKKCPEKILGRIYEDRAANVTNRLPQVRLDLKTPFELS